MEKNTLLVLIILVVSTILCRSLPFLILRKYNGENEYLEYLGETLPQATIAMLVVYCLKNVNFSSPENFLPEIISSAIVVGLGLMKKSSTIVILAGTFSYMFLIRMVF